MNAAPPLTRQIEGEALDMREGLPVAAALDELLDSLRHRYSEADFERLRQLGIIDDRVRLIDGLLWSE
jgi:hypothetical protein